MRLIQLGGSKTMADPYEWPMHVFAKVIDHMKHISGMIMPGGCPTELRSTNNNLFLVTKR